MAREKRASVGLAARAARATEESREEAGSRIVLGVECVCGDDGVYRGKHASGAAIHLTHVDEALWPHFGKCRWQITLHLGWGCQSYFGDSPENAEHAATIALACGDAADDLRAEHERAVEKLRQIVADVVARGVAS